MIIQRYSPKPMWLWRQWYGTVLYDTSTGMVINMLWAAAFCVLMQHLFINEESSTWAPFVKHELGKMAIMWPTLQGLTNFMITFFTSQAFTYWRASLSTGRSIQGRFSDISMILATHAARDYDKKDGTYSSYTIEAQVFLQLLAHKLRLVHVMAWASTAKQFRVLLTQRGLDRMVDRGFLLEQERDRLLSLHLTPSSLWIGMLESALMDCQEAIRDPKIINKAYTANNSNTLELTLLETFLTLRGLLGSIPNMVSDRMPLAYVHFTQLLVDMFLIGAPIARYNELGWWTIVGVGLLTLFYRGFLDLAKVFLDPLDNEDFCEGCVYLDLGVFIREANVGSTKFMNGAAQP